MLFLRARGRQGGECHKEEWTGYLVDDLEAFANQTDQRMVAAQQEGGCYQTAKQGAESLTTEWIAAERAKSALRQTAICPNRVAQGKRARDIFACRC